jgi:hypothetical protein
MKIVIELMSADQHLPEMADSSTLLTYKHNFLASGVVPIPIIQVYYSGICH